MAPASDPGWPARVLADPTSGPATIPAPLANLVVHVDSDLLVLDKPSGWNTHAPSAQAQPGIYEWVCDQLDSTPPPSLPHRLDKETSGILILGLSTRANKSLSLQFSDHTLTKTYHFLTDGVPPADSWTEDAPIHKGAKGWQAGPEGHTAITDFQVIDRRGQLTWVQARPRTGRTHQIRLHATRSGIPVLGDRLYGAPAFDAPWPRLFLHAARMELTHPATGERATYEAPWPSTFAAAWNGEQSRTALTLSLALDRRKRLFDLGQTDAFRLVHGLGDGLDDLDVDRLGDRLLISSERDRSEDHSLHRTLRAATGIDAVYVRRLRRDVRHAEGDELASRLVAGTVETGPTLAREAGVAYRVDPTDGYSCGLFLDQRETRRRLRGGRAGLLTWIGARPRSDLDPSAWTMLNLFAYTGSLSVAAAQGGATVTTLDLSKRYLDWGRENFQQARLDPTAHDWIFGDALDWLPRLAKKSRTWDVVVVDPPTFSSSKKTGAFSMLRDTQRLARMAAAVVAPGGVLMISTNASKLDPVDFRHQVEAGVTAAGRRVLAARTATQPPDFPESPARPPYLKIWWGALGS